MTQVQGRGLVPLVSIVYGFGDFYENLKHFEDRFFLVTLIHQEAYAVVYDVRDGVEVSVFPKYWNDSHFLIGNGLYIYKEDDFSQRVIFEEKTDEFCQRSWLYQGVTPSDEASHKDLKRLVDTHLLVDVRSSEERKISFGKSWKLLASSSLTCLLMIYLV